MRLSTVFAWTKSDWSHQKNTTLKLRIRSVFWVFIQGCVSYVEHNSRNLSGHLARTKMIPVREAIQTEWKERNNA